MCMQIQSVIINITLFILVQSAHDTPWRVDQLGDNKHKQSADRCLSKPMHLITRCNAHVILSRTGTVGFRFLMADACGKHHACRYKLLHLCYANHSLRQFDGGMIS